MTEFKAIRPVYTYYFPEIRDLVSKMTKTYPHDVYLQSIKPGLDKYEEPVMDKLFQFYKKDISGLKEFQFRYPTSGSTEGIFHLLVHIKTNFLAIPVYVLKGEYEGYREHAAGIGLKVTEIEEADMLSVPIGIWFISNPSARNGNIIPNDILKQLMDRGHKVVYDLAYIGMTKQYLFDVSHPNVMAVLISLSKPFGVFYYRSGFTFSRQEITTLYGNKWFKNIFSIMLADKIFSSFTSDYFYTKYHNVQKQIIDEINSDFGLKLKSSDSMLLAYMNIKDDKDFKIETQSIIKPFKRGDWYRFCLTQYFIDRLE